MQLGTRAVVLSAKNLEEHDRLVVLLTEDLGVVTAYARGARRQKGAMSSATEQLSYSAFQLFRNRERTFVDRAETETIFFAIRQDMERLALASYFCQLCQELIPEGENQPGYLHLMMNTLTLLDRGKMPLSQLKAVFELRLLTMSGYMPDLVACAVCGDLTGEGGPFCPFVRGALLSGMRSKARNHPPPAPGSGGVPGHAPHHLQRFWKALLLPAASGGTGAFGRCQRSVPPGPGGAGAAGPELL